MKIIFSLSISIVLMHSCNNTIQKTFITNKTLPINVLNIYREKAGLPSLEEGGEYLFELRKWDLFDRSSTFPTKLERHFFEKGKFKTEYYVFSNKLGKAISSSSELDTVTLTKVEIVFPQRLYDSLVVSYNLNDIEKYPTDLDPINNYSTYDRINIFYEERRKNTYKAIYLVNPLIIVDE